MGIARSPCSRGSGGRGNLAVEACRREGVSRNASEPDSASLRNLRVASPPNRWKPAIVREATSSRSATDSPGWLGTAYADRVIRNLRETLDFLGFTFRYDCDLYGRKRKYLNVFPSRKSLARLRDRLREITGPQWGWKPAPTLVGEVNRYLRGWGQYFHHGYPAKAFHAVNGFAQARLVRHLQRRSQRRFRLPADRTWYAHLQSLGLQLLVTKGTTVVHAL